MICRFFSAAIFRYLRKNMLLRIFNCVIIHLDLGRRNFGEAWEKM